MATKTYKVRYYRIAIYERGADRLDSSTAGFLLEDLLANAGNISFPQVSLTPGYEHQIRDVQLPVADRICGCFAKLRPDAPHIVRNDSEQKIPLQPGDKIVDKSFWIYFPSRSLLVIQINRDGGSASRLVEYINKLLGVKYLAVKEDVIHRDALEKLDEHSVKWFEVSFVKPRSLQGLDPYDWSSNTIGDLGGINADRVKIRVSAPRGDDLGSKAGGFIKNLFKLGEPTCLKAKFEDIISPIDLLSEVIQGEIHVALTDGYPNSNDVVSALLQTYMQQQDTLQRAFGDDEVLP